MAWPVPGYTTITSKYGMRTHPITGVYKLHSGVDISAPTGTNFIAAADGVVTKATYNTAYGNMVMIDHGGGISTLYAHGSEIMVQVGQEVKKNDVVLKVGSTGYATGPHAHFEVRINGSTVEPLDYITSSTQTTDKSGDTSSKGLTAD
jgi:murein DD-endopeptidase MepM/ murein hydrolase activator NlpD